MSTTYSRVASYCSCDSMSSPSSGGRRDRPPGRVFLVEGVTAVQVLTYPRRGSRPGFRRPGGSGSPSGTVRAGASRSAARCVAGGGRRRCGLRRRARSARGRSRGRRRAPATSGRCGRPMRATGSPALRPIRPACAFCLASGAVVARARHETGAEKTDPWGASDRNLCASVQSRARHEFKEPEDRPLWERVGAGLVRVGLGGRATRRLWSARGAGATGSSRGPAAAFAGTACPFASWRGRRGHPHHAPDSICSSMNATAAATPFHGPGDFGLRGDREVAARECPGRERDPASRSRADPLRAAQSTVCSHCSSTARRYSRCSSEATMRLDAVDRPVDGSRILIHAGLKLGDVFLDHSILRVH